MKMLFSSFPPLLLIGGGGGGGGREKHLNQLHCGMGFNITLILLTLDRGRGKEGGVKMLFSSFPPLLLIGGGGREKHHNQLHCGMGFNITLILLTLDRGRGKEGGG